MGKTIGVLKTIGTVLVTRAIPALTLAILFGVVAVQFDKWRINEAPASDFINYTAFDVQNARANEDVYFKVCREHEENYTYAGALTVYIYRDIDPEEKPDNSTPTKVFARDIGGSIRTECENKVLRASDFRHSPGTYKMAFCVDFTVKYDIQKTACKDSNIYKIYPQPTDIKQQLEYYQDQIDILNDQLQDKSVDGANSLERPSSANNGNTATPTEPQAPQRQYSSVGTPSRIPPESIASEPQPVNDAAEPPADEIQPECTVDIGIGLFCGDDGLIRL